MSKTKLLLDVVSDMQSLADSLKALADAMTSSEAPADLIPDEPASAPSKPEPPKITVEQIRAVLADKSQSGLTANVRELLMKFGVARLSELSPERYPEMLKAAEELK